MKKKRYRRKTTFKKKKQDLVRVRWGHKSTYRVDQDLPSCCTGQSFNKPEPVQLLGPGSTRQNRDKTEPNRFEPSQTETKSSQTGLNRFLP